MARETTTSEDHWQQLAATDGVFQIYAAATTETTRLPALAARNSYGGTAPERVAEQLAALRVVVDEHAAWATAP